MFVLLFNAEENKFLCVNSYFQASTVFKACGCMSTLGFRIDVL